MSGTELSYLQDELVSTYLSGGSSALAQALSDDLDHDDRMSLLMVNIIKRAQDLEQA